MNVINVGSSTCNSNGCSGAIELDLSQHNGITFTFIAPSGLQFDVTTQPSKYKFQFQMTSTSTSCDLSLELQDAVISFDGNALANKDSYVTSIGKCDGCSHPEIFGSFTYLGQSGPIKFRKYQATVNYDPNSVCKGTMTFTWDWNGYAWLKISTENNQSVQFSNLVTDSTTDPTLVLSGTNSRAIFSVSICFALLLTLLCM